MRTAPLATTALLLLPSTLAAEELELGLRSGVSWTDNVFGVADDAQFGGQDDDPEDDFTIRVTPQLSVKDTDGELTWAAHYRPSYEAYLDFGELDGFDHAAAASVAWRFAERWEIKLDESYALYQSAVRFNEAVDPGDELLLAFRDQEVRTNRTNAVLEHLLTPRDTLILTLGYNDLEYPDGGGNDRTIPSVALAYRHKLSERTQLGARFSWVQQQFDRQLGGGGDDTNFFNLAATLEHSFSRRLRLEAAAGPTLVESSPVDDFRSPIFAVRNIRFPGSPILPIAVDANDCELGGVPGRAGLNNYNGCGITSDRLLTNDEARQLQQTLFEPPTVDPDGRPVDASDTDDTDFTYFARIALVRDWESWRARLMYQRSNSERSRFGSSTVADSFSASLTYQPTRLWVVTFGAGLSFQEQSVDQTFPIAFQLVNVPAPPGITSVAEVAEIQSLVVASGDNGIEYVTRSASVNVTRQLTRRSSAFASLQWHTQQQETDFAGQDRRWNNLTLWVGFEWNFDPIRF